MQEVPYDALCKIAGRLFFESQLEIERLSQENGRLLIEMQRYKNQLEDGDNGDVSIQA